MLKDYKVTQGAVDMHVHALPDFHPRLMTEVEILRDAKEYGMRAIVSKCHYCLNADRMALVNSLVEGITCFGGVVLNPPVGGINPSAVEAAIRYGGKEIWMPSFYSKEHLLKVSNFKGAVKGYEEGISILHEGELIPQMHEILDLIASANVILGTSHSSSEEIGVLVKEASRHGVKKIVVTHPYSTVPNLSLDKQAELAELGAYMELCLFSAMPISPVNIRMENFVATIKTVGADKVVLATDFGQPYHPSPAEGMRIFCNGLLTAGISTEEINTMARQNPAFLLDL
jgi:hypothetical protein